MITDLLSEHEVLTFAKILADRDEASSSWPTRRRRRGTSVAEATKLFFEKVAQWQSGGALQAVAPNSVHPEMHRERIKCWKLHGARSAGLCQVPLGARLRNDFRGLDPFDDPTPGGCDACTKPRKRRDAGSGDAAPPEEEWISGVADDRWCQAR